MEYKEFLKNKQVKHNSKGIYVDALDLNNKLFAFQRDIVKWSLGKGKSAIFAECGLGKTPMQLEWANQIYKHTGQDILILAPLAVSRQTVQEGKKFGIKVNICRSQADVKPGINITNYEILEKFNADSFVGVVLDESSILKAYTGKTKQAIVDKFKNTEFKLACTATPSPNDHMEILNHAAFLNVMKSHEALAIWFINDSMNCGSYRLKNHAINDFWDWVASWAVGISKPSDIGYEDEGFNLPKLNIIQDVVEVDLTVDSGDQLFRTPELSATSFHKEKRLTLLNRVKKTVELVNKSDEQCLVWCDTNYEADALKKALPGAVEIRGSDNTNKKEQAAIDFVEGKIRVLISKPSIFGFGLNLQNCHKAIFCGLSFSYEAFYQTVRRIWRYGQENEVTCYVVIGETEKQILDVIKKKENMHEQLKKGMIDGIKRTQNINMKKVEYQMDYKRHIEKGDNWTAVMGDCIDEIKHIPNDSLHFQIFSPPFSQLYIYSDSYRDMGNNKNDETFFQNFEYLIPELLRTLMPGRLCAVHCKQLVNYKNRDGASGLRDFRGEIIKAFQKHGFIYHSEVTIWKDPVIEMQRTKSHGLLYKQLRKDSTYSRQGLPDYLVIFRKWGEDKEPVTKTKEGFPLEMWQQYASPVWMDIKQTNCLNIKQARDDRDEKHICPLQLDVIERAVALWTNEGDVVFSPFGGIGSEGYQAIKMGRKAYLIELKESYFNTMTRNLKQAEEENKQMSLFDIEGAI